MSRQLLIETKMNALSLCEGVQSKNPNCLGTISGPCADYDSETRNGNFYSRKLWENVFNDPLVKEALEDRVLFGELDHPESRLETHLSEACIVMTGYEFDDNEKVVKGTFDILPTEKGKLLRSLLDYGCKLGVSSRGEGDVTEGVNGRHDVAEDGSYYFVGFDAVALPAVRKAKPALQESVHKRQAFKESLTEQINNVSTKSDLDMIRKVLEATELPEMDSLVESINIKSKELEGSNDSSNLMEDLENMTNQNHILTEENKQLKREVTDCESRVKRFADSYMEECKRSEGHVSELSKLKESYNEVVFKYSSESKKVERLEKELGKVRDTIKRLRESIRTTGSTKDELESKISSLEESLERSQSNGHEKTRMISNLREQLDRVTAELTESQKALRKQSVVSKKKIDEANKSVEKIQKSLTESQRREQSAIVQYAKTQAKAYGIDSKRIVESITPKTKASDIDKLISTEVDRIDRYRNLPTPDKTISSLSESVRITLPGQSKLDEEGSQSKSFMEQFYNNK